MYLDLEIATSFACYRKEVWVKPDFFYKYNEIIRLFIITFPRYNCISV